MSDQRQTEAFGEAFDKVEKLIQDYRDTSESLEVKEVLDDLLVEINSILSDLEGTLLDDL